MWGIKIQSKIQLLKISYLQLFICPPLLEHKSINSKKLNISSPISIIQSFLLETSLTGILKGTLSENGILTSIIDH